MSTNARTIVETQLNPTPATTVAPDQSTTSKKFATQQDNSFPNVGATSNMDSIVNIGAGLKSLAIVIDSMASRAATEAAATRAMISALSPDLNASQQSNRPQITESDVTQQQMLISQAVKPLLPTFRTNSVDRTVDKTVDMLLEQSRIMIMPPYSDCSELRVENKIIPDIPFVEVKLKKGRGVSDSFYTTVNISLPVDQVDAGNVKLVRIFAAKKTSPNLTRELGQLSLQGMDRLLAVPLTTRAKNSDILSSFEKSLNDSGVKNDLTDYNPADRFTNQRVTYTPTQMNISGVIDQSVSQNTNFINASRIQNPDSGFYEYPPAIIAGASTPGGTNVGVAHDINLATETNTFNLILQPNNAASFKCVYSAAPANFSARQIGSQYVLSFDDDSVKFGNQYMYYAVTVNKDMIQSNRSVIVTVTLDGLRVPARPKNVLTSTDNSVVTLFATVDDHFVEKFEIWKKDTHPSNKRGFYITELENGYGFADEVVNPEHLGGASWRDQNVVPGRDYSYRVYSVDVFGNKSESPFEVVVQVPDILGDYDPGLTRPSLLAEVDSKTQKVKINIQCDDPNVINFYLQRRDLSMNQPGFAAPYESSRLIMGNATAKHSSYLKGERIENKNVQDLWTGHFQNVSGGVEFIDRLTSFDRTYQYRVYGLDSHGKRTSYDYSSPVLTYRKPMINVPVNTSSSFVTGSDGSINGVMISWQSASLDVSSEDQLGSQKRLANTSVRTLYQLERQTAGDSTWSYFNMTKEQNFFDPLEGYNGDIAPGFRPPFLQLNKSYNYRVQSVMSGGFVSNRSPPLSVFVGYNLATPINFTLRTPDARTRPFYIMLNWDTPAQSGPVDRWYIERCEVNNFASQRINIKNPDEFANLNFVPYRTVFSEASRFRSFWPDTLYAPQSTSPIFVGQHHLMDMQVIFGNTYFYRIFAADVTGKRSLPAYRAVRLTYTWWDWIFRDLLSTYDITKLTNNFVPVHLAPNVNPDAPLDSESLTPEFSTPRANKSIESVTTNATRMVY
jgi:hypothetical protein